MMFDLIFVIHKLLKNDLGIKYAIMDKHQLKNCMDDIEFFFSSLLCIYHTN